MTQTIRVEYPNFDLQSYFVHPTLLLTAVDAEGKLRIQEALKRASIAPQPYSGALLQSVFSDETKRFIVANKVPALEELLITGQVTGKGYVTTDRAFYFKGLPKAIKNRRKNLPVQYVEFKARLPEYSHLRICGKLDPDKITTSSAHDRLSGQHRLFMFAYISTARADQINLRPIVIADKVNSTKSEALMPISPSSLEVFTEHIDEFRNVGQVDSRDVRIDELRGYDEKQIKKWFAEIIGEQFVTKDWGGEQSDLYTSHLHLNGERIRAAFILKGPSRFHVMKNTDLGKNGDQIVRLFREPAELYILQHCHFVSTEVRHTMAAFASRFFQLSKYSIIDGNDTLRILKAYKKISV